MAPYAPQPPGAPWWPEPPGPGSAAAPHGYGLAAHTGRITEVHRLAAPWPAPAWLPGPSAGTEVPTARHAVASCGSVLDAPTGPPRRELLEDLCADCASTAAQPSRIVPC